MTTTCQRLSDLSAPRRAAQLQTSAGHTQTCTLSVTGTRLVDSSVLNSMNTFSAGPDNDFVADTLKVMNVGQDGGRRRWISCRYHQQAGPSAALVMTSPQRCGGRGRSHAIGRRGRHRDLRSSWCPQYVPTTRGTSLFQKIQNFHKPNRTFTTLHYATA